METFREKLLLYSSIFCIMIFIWSFYNLIIIDTIICLTDIVHVEDIYVRNVYILFVIISGMFSCFFLREVQRSVIQKKRRK